MPFGRHWIVTAPPGHWSTGPHIVEDEERLDGWREMGWEISGPFILEGTEREQAILTIGRLLDGGTWPPPTALTVIGGEEMARRALTQWKERSDP